MSLHPDVYQAMADAGATAHQIAAAYRAQWLLDEGRDRNHIYVASTPTRVKIGISGDPQTRMRSLKARIGEDVRLEWSHQGAPDLIKKAEAMALATAAPHRIAGEWFDMPAHRAIELVSGIIGELAEDTEVGK